MIAIIVDYWHFPMANNVLVEICRGQLLVLGWAIFQLVNESEVPRDIIEEPFAL